MKILAIRGRNLTALAGDFAVELDRAPLAGAGLFALTGPTGAGKTTLLDALCLALFDRTPRLSGRSEVKLGEDESVSAADARNLLRRGTGEGHAEVEFLGRDGVRYRARWAVWRARNLPSGKLQPAELALYRVDGALVCGGKKTEVLAAIEQRLGLSFDQFTRSVLLAQGEFAAFLKASARERADLLERMTGTALFREISRAAYRRMSAAIEKRDALATARDDTPRLDPLARAALEQELDRATLALPPLQEALERARAAVAWHTEEARRRDAVHAAEGALDEARAALAALEPLAQELAGVLAVKPLRALREAVEEAQHQLDQAHQASVACSAAAQGQAQRLGALQAQTEHALQTLQLLRAEQLAQAPLLRKARALDGQVAAALQHARQAAEELAHHTRQREAAAQRQDACAKEVASAARELDRLERELRARAPTAPLAREWPRWQSELGRHLGQARAERAAQTEVETAQARWSDLTSARQRAEADRQPLQQALHAATSALAAARTTLDGLPLHALQQARAALQHERDLHLQRVEVAARAREIAQERSLCTEALADARARSEALERSLAETQQLHHGLRVRSDEAQLHARAVRARLDLAAHRAELVEGEPCPLCGACEHPFATLSLGEGLRADADARVQALQAELEQAADKLLATRAALAAATQEGRAHQARLEQLHAQRGALETRFAGLGGSGDPAQAAVAQQLDEAGGALQAQARALEEREAAHARAQLALEQAREAHAAALRAVEQNQSLTGQLDQQLERAVDALRDAEARAGQHAAELREGRALLDPLFADGGWEAALTAQGEAFVGRCAQEVAAFQAATVALEAAREGLASGTRAEQEAGRALTALAPQEERARALCAEAHAARERLASERAGLLGGLSADAVEAEASARLASAESTHGALLAALETERRRAEQHRAEVAAAQALHAERVALCARHRTALEAALAQLGLGAEALAARLSRDEAWISSAQAAWAAAQQGAARAQTVLDERLAQHRAHQLEAPPDDAPRAAQRAAELGAAHAAATEARFALVHRREADDAAQARFLARSQDHQRAAQEAQVWERLGALIGSADGARFQKFVQGLTLELLLEQANQHLGELAPRYRLERIPGQELELQVVDRDMGDEIRATASLSGGELFLASLALALGLSALSAQQTAVDSLFIDEGFGTLDPETLEVALSALDGLQAQGRQVGLISHVAGLAERVGAQVQVWRRGAGRSEVRVVGLDPAMATAPVNVLARPRARRKKPSPRAPAE